MNNAKEIKQQLYAKCLEYVNSRIDTAKKAMDAAQEAANQESKSSAGDKYETGRSMMQLERDRCASLLMEALKLKKELDQIDPEKTCDSVQPGSLVFTGQGNYFIAISVGKITVNRIDYFAISLASPIGQQLRNTKVNDEIIFANKQFIIKEIY